MRSELQREAMVDPAYHDRVYGCLLGGAIGDALGAPIEFWSLPRIQREHGPEGVTDLVPMSAGLGLVTDDTQMTLFTAEGMIEAHRRSRTEPGVHAPSVVYQAYLRWLTTQETSEPPAGATGLAAEPWLYARRAPGNTCLSGLAAPGMGTLARPKNPHSKGCGTVMRSAPFGLVRSASNGPEDAFDYAVECAVTSHGHPTGYLAAGAFAAIIRLLIDDLPLVDAVHATLDILRRRPHHEETSEALDHALKLASTGRPTPERVEILGGGWVAEEALAIGVYAALAYNEDERGLRPLVVAVNHSGDSDSTGSICGNLIGAQYGSSALPADWMEKVEGRQTIWELSLAFAQEFFERS